LFFLPFRGRLDAASLNGELFLACSSALLPLCIERAACADCQASKRRMPVTASLPKRPCRACGLGFVPDARNSRHQDCCTRKVCVRRRKRVRQRLWHRKRYGLDASFREEAKSRVRRHRKRAFQAQAQAQAQGPPTRAAEGRLQHLEQAFLGLAMQMGEEPDAMQARELVSAWADTGSRRGAGTASGP
jgi:hypothetical protein